MSKYTTELRFICEHSAGLTESVGYNSIDSVLDGARDKVFDFDYPIFDESYRTTLENKILKHYYTREICCETVGLWKLFLNRKMNEIMPYYNQLYKSALIEFNPMYDVDLTTAHQRVDDNRSDKSRGLAETTTIAEQNTYTENTNNSTATATNQETDNATETKTENKSTNKNDHWEYFSDTPEGGINGVENLNYLTNATHITDNGAGSTSESTVNGSNNTDTETLTNGESNTDKNGADSKNKNDDRMLNEATNEKIRNIEDYLQHVSGKRGNVTYSKMLEEYRKTFLNIDMMVINDLRDLFINLW